MKWLKVALLIGLTGQLHAQKTTVDLIYDDLRTGRIDSVNAMALLASWLEGAPASLQYASGMPVKCGTFVVAQLETFRNQHPEMKKKQRLASQTFYDHNFLSKGVLKTFRINYDSTGANAVPPIDLNLNQVPDWVEETGFAFEHSYRLEVDTLGYKEPLNFSRAPFYYPIYIEDLNTDYGYTESINQITSNPDTYTTSIFIENDYVESNYATHGYDALRVTCAHEFFHAIQFSYVFRFEDVWYYESSATWMEDVAYDDVNDYYAYLPALFSNPQSTMTSQGIEYAMCVWNHMIEKKYGRQTIRKSWENMVTMTSLPSINQAITSTSNSDLALNYSDFARWNFFTADRADSVAYYSEGTNYPKVRAAVSTLLRDTVVQSSLGNLASHYFHVWTVDSANCTINFTKGVPSSEFSISTVEYNAGTGKRFVQGHGTSTTIQIDGLAPGDSLAIIVSNTKVSTAFGTTGYFLSLVVNENQTTDDVFSDFYMYPSPFRPSTGTLKLKFRLRKATNLTLDIYSLTGKAIRKLNLGSFVPGNYDGLNMPNLTWDGKTQDGRASASGVYFYVLKGDGFKKTGKLALVR